MVRFQGFRNLKKCCSAFQQAENGSFTPENVLAVNSAAQGMFLIASYVLQPGDEAIILDPVDFLFKNP